MKFTIILFFALLSTTPLHAADFKLTSPVFREGERIPAQYTCDGKNISPPLEWNEVPRSAQSLALILRDPDAPGGEWVHWVLFDLPPTINNLPGGIPPIRQLANSEIHGLNDFKKLGYGGPCPPAGTHRYFFRLYALNTVLRLDPGTPAREVEKTMAGHVVAEAALMGRYQRSKKG